MEFEIELEGLTPQNGEVYIRHNYKNNDCVEDGKALLILQLSKVQRLSSHPPTPVPAIQNYASHGADVLYEILSAVEMVQ